MFIFKGGWAVRKDLKEAERLYLLAAHQGYVLAQSNLGRIYTVLV